MAPLQPSDKSFQRRIHILHIEDTKLKDDSSPNLNPAELLWGLLKAEKNQEENLWNIVKSWWVNTGNQIFAPPLSSRQLKCMLSLRQRMMARHFEILVCFIQRSNYSLKSSSYYLQNSPSILQLKVTRRE